MRFIFKVVDDEETVLVAGSTYVGEIDENGNCESIELELFSALRALRRKQRLESCSE